MQSGQTTAVSRRAFLAAGALAPAALRAQGAAPPAAAFTTSINVEIMFPRSMPRSERIKTVAAQGIKVYSFWRPSAEEQKAMLETQQQLGMKCSCVVGSGSTSRTTGLTRCLMSSSLLFASRTSVRNPIRDRTPGSGGRQ